jgi:hypothetical protein
MLSVIMLNVVMLSVVTPRYLNRLQTVTYGNKTVILPFVLVYCTLNE